MGNRIELPAEDVVPPGPYRHLLVELHQLYKAAGRPALRTLSAQIQDDNDLPATLSHEAIRQALKGAGGIPRWPTLKSLVWVLARHAQPYRSPDAEVERFLHLYEAAGEILSLPVAAPAVSNRSLPYTPEAVPAGAGEQMLRELAEEITDPVDEYRSVAAWHRRALAALNRLMGSDSTQSRKFKTLADDLVLPAPSLAESWDLHDFEERFRQATGVLMAAAEYLQSIGTISDTAPNPHRPLTPVEVERREKLAAYLDLGVGETQTEVRVPEDAIRKAKNLIHGLRNFETDSREPYYIGRTLIDCASFLGEYRIADGQIRVLVNELIKELDASERKNDGLATPTISVSKEKIVMLVEKLREICS